MTDSSYYYSGSFAELAPNASEITLHYLNTWLKTNNALGIAYQLLHMPYSQTTENLLTTAGNSQVYLNLKTEEAILYRNTILSYKPQVTPDSTPQLTINFRKALSPQKIFSTIKLLLSQSIPIAYPNQVVSNTKQWLEQIPSENHTTSSEQASDLISQHVFPYVLALGATAEFFARYYSYTNKQSYLAVRPNDPKVQALQAMAKVQTGELTLQSFLDQYGLNADQDYELTCPRWLEIPEQLHLRIKNLKLPPTNLSHSQDHPTKYQTLKTLQSYRMQTRQKLLRHLYSLRQNLLNESIISATTSQAVQPAKNQILIANITEGNGTALSPGLTSGKAIYITDPLQQIPDNSICIIPNASPLFSHLYTQCNGIIFLQAGQTSHGAIVAREFSIPAITDQTASHIPEQSRILLNATQGIWKLVK